METKFFFFLSIFDRLETKVFNILIPVFIPSSWKFSCIFALQAISERGLELLSATFIFSFLVSYYMIIHFSYF